jgi:hypothetical protein
LQLANGLPELLDGALLLGDKSAELLILGEQRFSTSQLVATLCTGHAPVAPGREGAAARIWRWRLVKRGGMDHTTYLLRRDDAAVDTN